MKKFLPFLLCLYGFAFAGESVETLDATKEKELQWIFEKDFLNAEDTQDFIYLHASKISEEHQNSVSAEELVKHFKALTHTPEFQKKFVAIYASIFDEEERKQVHKLLQNKHFLANRHKMGQAFLQCYIEMKKMMEKLVITLPQSHSTKTKNEILHLNQGNIEEFLSSDKPLVIDVYTDWCGPCKAIAPIIEELNQELGHQYQFVKLNAEQEVELANAFQIQGYPTILLIKDGEIVERLRGFMNKAKLLAHIKRHFE
jgi:thioredoxin 1